MKLTPNESAVVHVMPHPEDVKGRVHSIESFGTVDGPGIRFVVFLQGCYSRCLYCHNPDTRSGVGGKEMTALEVIQEACRYRSYFETTGGGITVTGGDPLYQPEFTAAIFQLARSQGLHTALDTLGYCDLPKAIPVLEHTDLILLDIKAFEPSTYHRVTSLDLAPTLQLAEEAERRGIKMWIRYVLVPGLTDNSKEIADLAHYVSQLKMVERIQILGFHKMGEYKWQSLGFPYELKETPAASQEEINVAKKIFAENGCGAKVF